MKKKVNVTDNNNAVPMTLTEPFSYGINKVREKFWFCFGLLMISFILNLLIKANGKSVWDALPLVYIMVALVLYFISAVYHAGVVRIFLNICDGKPTGYYDLFSIYDVLWRYIGGTILYIAVIIGGMILLVVPGVIWGLKYNQFFYYIIDKNCGIKESFKRSALAMEGHKTFMLKFILLAALFNLAGALCLLIGLLVTVPATWLGHAYIYRKLDSLAFPAATVPSQTEAVPSFNG